LIVYHSVRTRPGSRLGSRVLTGSSGRPGQFFFFKSKRRRFSIKKVNPSGFFFSCFFFNPTRFQPRIGQVSKPCNLLIFVCLVALSFYALALGLGAAKPSFICLILLIFVFSYSLKLIFIFKSYK
jgi:hypothetical protein